MDRETRVLQVICAAFCIPLAGLLWVAAKHGLAHYEQEYSFEAKYGLNPNEIYLNGAISKSMARKLDSLIDSSEEPSITVFIDSPGGTGTGAEEIVRVFAEHENVTLRLFRGARCFSACVGVFAGVRKLDRAVTDDDACFLFHAGTKEPAEAAASACELRPAESTKEPDRWTALISPNLTAFFEQCARNPAHTLEGISLDGRQLAQIVNGGYTIRCDDHVMSKSCSGLLGNRSQCR
ncbi:hypothetical protein [Rhizobium sp. AAP116]|uniref:hypothetical protein n=1 Tax=Rhizobium sp. AAP116 TaxID=1523429 RepID=UPI0006B9DA79|nr:hypothetical protein [Rhizobium sp. AAP116]KPF57187.1 hypothetical protein IP85_14485 [Rhizobium sp. AAP116]